MNYFGEADSDHVFVTCQPSQPGQHVAAGGSRKKEEFRKCLPAFTQHDGGNVYEEIMIKK